MTLMNRSKEGFFSNSDVLVGKIKQYGEGNVILWTGIVDQTIIGPYKVYKEVILDSVSYCGFVNKTFFAGYKFQSLENSVHLCTTMLFS